MTTIMVSSTVWNIKPMLTQVHALLTNHGYEVWMSDKGTIPVDPRLSNDENSVEAAKNCDCFLGIVTGRWGSGIFANEIREAVAHNKPRWFLVSQRVVDAREILKQYRTRSSSDTQGDGLRERAKRGVTRRVAGVLRNAAEIVDPTSTPAVAPGWDIPFRRNSVLETLEVLDLYDELISSKVSFGERKGNWVQPFVNDDDVKRFVQTQFSSVKRIDDLLDSWST